MQVYEEANDCCGQRFEDGGLAVACATGVLRARVLLANAHTMLRLQELLGEEDGFMIYVRTLRSLKPGVALCASCASCTATACCCACESG